MIPIFIGSTEPDSFKKKASQLTGFLCAVVREGEISNSVVHDMIDFVEVVKAIEGAKVE